MAPAARERGYDASKKITDRKRHIAADTDGRLLMVNRTAANISGLGRGAKGAEGIRAVLAVAQVPVWRQRLRPHHAHGQGLVPRLHCRSRPYV